MGRASASAPASIGNVAVGFDIIGQSFDAVRDSVTAVREARPGVRLGGVSGLVEKLPDSPSSNTALAAAEAVLSAASHPFGVTLLIDKGVPLAAGMGGSAASAVAAAAAVNALLDEPFSTGELLPFALEGERLACDPPHWDNVMASLLGGLVLAASEEPPLVRRLAAPTGIVTVLLHPAVETKTRAARAVLASQVPRDLVVEQSRRLAAFATGCATGDLELVKAGLEDLWIEPQRAHLLPAFYPVKGAAMEAGALGCSFSGSGPSVFAWALKEDADAIEDAMASAFMNARVAARAYRAPLLSEGVRIEKVA